MNNNNYSHVASDADIGNDKKKPRKMPSVCRRPQPVLEVPSQNENLGKHYPFPRLLTGLRACNVPTVWSWQSCRVSALLRVPHARVHEKSRPGDPVNSYPRIILSGGGGVKLSWGNLIPGKINLGKYYSTRQGKFSWNNPV